MPAFEQKLALGTTECAPLAAKYKTESKRCRDAVELTAEALEEFIDKLEGKGLLRRAVPCAPRISSV